MLKINIEIDNAAFEESVAKSITLSPGDDLSKEITNNFIRQLKQMANQGADVIAEEQVKESVRVATEQKKAEFETVIEEKLVSAQPIK